MFLAGADFLREEVFGTTDLTMAKNVVGILVRNPFDSGCSKAPGKDTYVAVRGGRLLHPLWGFSKVVSGRRSTTIHRYDCLLSHTEIATIILERRLFLTSVLLATKVQEVLC